VCAGKSTVSVLESKNEIKETYRTEYETVSFYSDSNVVLIITPTKEFVVLTLQFPDLMPVKKEDLPLHTLQECKKT
jgi:hypothetical protein